MSEKLKKYAIVLVYQILFSAGIFLFLLAAERFAPSMLERIKPIWEKSTDLKETAELFSKILGELIPF